ncbi:MAG: CHAT domain-containing protein, partial [Gemmataceae bacterium]
APGKRPVREGRLAAWVVRRDAAPVRVDLGEADGVEALLEAWSAAVHRGDVPDAGPLAERIWKPLAGHLRGAKTLFISPDANLAPFAFAALPAGPGRFLIEDAALGHVPAARLLPELAGRDGAAKAPSLLVVGGVTYDPSAARWASLPATRSEARATASAFAARFAGGAVTALGGERATRPAVLAAMGRARHVHLATHGFFADDDAETDPLLRSGVVLAGEAGSLTALEVGEADLSGCDLTVLSACQTGLGRRTGGEGMLGLQRALHVAGCRRVVSSVWSVDDAATSVLMGRFYHHLWKDGRTPLEALRQAQLDVLRRPELVEERVRGLKGELPGAEVALLRGVGKAAARLPGGERRGPPAWWAGWQLSGDWR